VPAELDTILRVALDSDPQRRYASGEAFFRDLDAYLSGEPIAARPAPFLRRAARYARNRRTQLVSAVAASGLIVAACAQYLERERTLRGERAEIARARELPPAQGLVLLESILARYPGSEEAHATRDRLLVERSRTLGRLLTEGEAHLRTGDVSEALAIGARVLALGPTDSRALAFQDRTRVLASSVRVRWVTTPSGAQVALREGGVFRELGPSPATTFLRPGVVVVRAAAPGRHVLQVPFLVRPDDSRPEIEAVLPELPPFDPAREDMVYVPAGEAVLGGPALNASPDAPRRVRGGRGKPRAP
jgi:hypothetical protein